MKKKQKPAPAAGFTHINNWGKRSKIAALPGCLREEVCRRLYDGGVRDFHFYTLNRAEQAYAICHLLGLRPSGDAA